MMLGVFWCVLKFPSLHGLFFEHLFCPLLLDAFLTSWCSLSVSCMSEGGAEKLDEELCAWARVNAQWSGSR